ncbi:MAG TPA: glycosyltransferase family 2 protein [Caulobacteraceae bacterium]|nr:glycosyltransferase family 2 protein [Caulobacteraceae bacterium]
MLERTRGAKATGRDGPAASVASAGYELSVVVPTFNERPNMPALVERLDQVLEGVAWQLIVVDDDSPDGTAEAVKAIAAQDPRVQCLRRVKRRGLAGAVVEGVLASAAPFVAVMDGDLQHDETLLPAMLVMLRAGEAELVVASRYARGAREVEALDPARRLGSRFANWLGRLVLRQELSDPVSGFFMIERGRVEAVAHRLTTVGFKVLFDIIASQREPLKIAELAYVFRARAAGGSKLDRRMVIDYLGLLLNKLTRGLIPTRALMFGLVGATGVFVQLAAVKGFLVAGLAFSLAQLLGSMVAMTSNYLINNEVTYRDRRKTGAALLTGYLKFCALCSIGLAANVAVASKALELVHVWWVASAAGAGFGALWNYVSTAAAVW